jgi:hypothetical protein
MVDSPVISGFNLLDAIRRQPLRGGEGKFTFFVIPLISSRKAA